MSEETLIEKPRTIATGGGKTMIPRAASSKPRRKHNRLLADSDTVIDYKNVQLLKNFVTDSGKILPRRLTGATGKEQRKIALAVKRARILALMPFCAGE